MSCSLLYDWRAYKRKVVERDSRGWRRAEVMRLQARRWQGTETPGGRAEAWPRLCQPQRGSAAHTSTSGFRPPGLKDHTFLLNDATPSVGLGCCSPRGSRRGNSFSSLGWGWGGGRTPDPCPALAFSPAVPCGPPGPGLSRPNMESFIQLLGENLSAVGRILQLN